MYANGVLGWQSERLWEVLKMSSIKTFDDKFDDSTPHTWYTITITSENGQRQTFRDIDHYHASDIYETLRELVEEWETE